MLRPTRKQLDFLSWEVGMFFHFGIRTFYNGHRDWDGEEMSPEKFCPESLDCRRWLQSAKLIGAKYAIMTAKHHDGFALWPTKLSPYSVAASPWKGGRGDVVREFTEACRAEGIKCGLYYSPAQWGSHAAEFKDGREYDDYFIGQVSELLSNYGKIDYIWFDGCGSNGHTYDQKRIVGEIHRLQPDILIFDMWDPDTRWVGNEDGYAPSPNLYEKEMNVLGERKTVFAPAECDCKLRKNWFYDLDEYSLKSVDELMGMYHASVGRGSNLLLNVGPDERGLLPERDVKRLSEFGSEIARLYGRDLGFEKAEKAGENLFISEYSPRRLKLYKETEQLPLVSAAVIQEDVSEGQHVSSWKLYARLPSLEPATAIRLLVAQGDTVGHKAIVRFPALRTARLELETTSREGEAVITDIKAY
ncbi:MAG: alpha-L-fucosidase [Clostridia bacterium]|nr:alpha-L-fucosidase [Clostridia bacterium]